MSGFRQRLAERQKRGKTLVCVGLDPLVEKMPDFLIDIHHFSRAESVANWMFQIARATAPFASMYKPQIAHWEAIPGGVEALKVLIQNIHHHIPGMPVFLDCKRGDIARTQQQYRVACLDYLGADGMNFSPYMGKDCMAALVDKNNLGRALVGLCYTSNPDAREVQDIRVQRGVGDTACTQAYWEFIAEKTLAWATELGVVEDAGLVMAAAYEKPKESGVVYSEHLTRCRQTVGNALWFLIPGVGAQGGFIAETVRAAYRGPGSIAINSSSEIDFASSGEDYAEAAAQKAKELRDKINEPLIW